MLQHALHHVVIVAVAGIDGDGAAVRLGERGERVVVGRVGQAERDDAAGLGPERLRMGALLGAVGQPAHLAMLAGGEEGGEPVAGLGAERGGAKPMASKPRARALAVADQLPRIVRSALARSPSGAVG